MRFKGLIIIFCILFPATGSHIFAQEPFFKQIPLSGTGIGFKINSICQDATGFIWLATNDGLWKNDGVAFVKVKLPVAIADPNITAIHPISEGGILAGTSKGKLFTMKGDSSTILADISDQEAVTISSICQTARDEFWFATFGRGVFRVKSKTMERYTMENGLGDNYIYSILSDSAGRIWIGSDGGLSYSEFKKNRYSFKNLTSKDGLPENIVRLVIKGPGNTIGVGMEELGFCLYNINNALFAFPDSFLTWSHGPVTALMKLQNEFWIGTQKSGIIDYEFQADRRMRQFSKAEGFPGLNVSAMFKDRSGNIWIGAGSELYLSPGEKIEFKRQVGKINLGIIHAILVDRHDNIWFSNDSGFYCYKKDMRNGFILTNPLNGTAYDGLNIISLYEDKYGHIWMGTFDKGVLRYDAEALNGRIFMEKNGLVNSSVLSIAGQDNEVWFATLGGVSKCVMEDSLINGNISFISYGEQNGLGNNFIYKIFIDSRKRVWFGTDGKGITRYADGQFTNYSKDQGLNSKIIYSITEDHSGAIWLSSSGDGVYRFDGKSFRNISMKQGLSDLNITSLVTDRNGNIIVIHKKGIDVLNPDNFQLISYGSEIGISDIDPDVNVVDVDRNGIVWMGTSSGIIKLNLDERAGDKQPELILKNVLCYLEQVDTSATKVFAYNRNHISFGYTTLWFSDPQKVIYQYKLNGYNREWITTGDRFVTFPNLRPGNYTFMIRTSVNNNFSNSEVKSFSFVIQYPIWQRTWFIALVAALAGLILYFYIRYRDEKLKSDERLKKEKIESQYEILKNQVNPHFLFNSFNTLITVIENDRDVAIEYVNKLSDFFRSILTYSEKDLIPVSEELELVEIYIFLQQKRYGANFSVNIDIPSTIRDTTLIPPLTLQILIENCLKHNAVSKETKLFVDIYIEDNKYLVVKNNINPRIKKEPSTGIGLSNLRNRYQLINDLEIVILDSGSYFSVKLPLIKN